jgi:hypothetical protein
MHSAVHRCEMAWKKGSSVMTMTMYGDFGHGLLLMSVLLKPSYAAGVEVIDLPCIVYYSMCLLELPEGWSYFNCSCLCCC